MAAKSSRNWNQGARDRLRSSLSKAPLSPGPDSGSREALLSQAPLSPGPDSGRREAGQARGHVSLALSGPFFPLHSFIPGAKA